MENTEIYAGLQHKLETYKPSAETIALVKATPKLFLVGITGAGKDTIIRELMKTGKYHLTISHTTRKPRANDGVMEQDGVNYHFITLEQAEAMIDAGGYIEAKQYSGNIYGTSAAELKVAHDDHMTAVTDIEIQGVAAYMALDPKTHAIFVLPPSYQVWQQRFVGRYGSTIDTADQAKRMARALEELEHALKVPYFVFVVNDVLETAVAEVDEIANGNGPVQGEDKARQIAVELCRELKAALALS